MNGYGRNLPSILGENSFERNYYVPEIHVESPENILAREDAVRYLGVIREKIRHEHTENMLKIKNDYEEHAVSGSE